MHCWHHAHIALADAVVAEWLLESSVHFNPETAFKTKALKMSSLVMVKNTYTGSVQAMHDTSEAWDREWNHDGPRSAHDAGALDVNENGNQLSLICCFNSVNDRAVSLIIGLSVAVFFSIAISAFPLILLINERIAGDARHPDSQSVFVYTTVGVLHNSFNFLCGRYTSGLGDYVGRKPMLIAALLAFIISRLLVLRAFQPGAFYLSAIIAGSLDCYYFSAMAWICDLFPSAESRSKRIGIFVGLGGGFAFVIGVPLGVILAVRTTVETPIILSIIICIVCVVAIILLPVNDMLGVHTADANPISCCSKRGLPKDIKAFMVIHFPLGPGTWKLIMQAKHPLDWLTNFLMHSTTGLANLILLQYCLAVFEWTVYESAGAVLSIGIGLAIFSPLFLHIFKPISVIFFAMTGFCLGLILLSVSGAGLRHSQVLGALGILCFAVCAVWVPAMQSMLTSEYDKNIQGTIGGLLSQENDLSLVFSYVMSLGFSFSIKRDSNVYWPGSSWAAAAIVALVSIAIHYHVHGLSAVRLERRIDRVTISSDEPPLARSAYKEEIIRDIELATTNGTPIQNFL